MGYHFKGVVSKMELISVVSLFVIYIMEPYFWTRSMDVMGRKYANKNLYRGIVLAYYLITVIKQIITLYDKNTSVSTLLGFVLISYQVVMTLILYKSSLISRLISVAVFIALTMVAEMLVVLFTTMVLHVPSEAYGTMSVFTNICTLSAKLILGGCCYLFYFRGKRNYITKLLESWEIIPMVLLNALFELPVSIILKRNDLQNDKFMLMTCITIQFMLFFITFYILFIVKRKNIGENKLIQKQMTMEDDMDPLSTWKIFDYDKDGQDSIGKPVLSPSEPALNIILENLNQLANEKDVNFQTSILVKKYYMKSSDICALVMGIVKSAMNMTCALEPMYRNVKLELSYIQGGFKLECQNSAVKGTQKIELQYSEGESDYIVRRYNGECFCKTKCEAKEYDTVIWYCCFHIKEIAEQQGVYAE